MFIFGSHACSEMQRSGKNRGKTIGTLHDKYLYRVDDSYGLVSRVKQIAHKDILLIFVSFIGKN